MGLIATYDLSARYYLALGLAIATTLAAYLLLRSRVSLGLLAIREDEEAAQATGVTPLRHKLGALVMSSFFAGLAGATFAFKEVGYYASNPYGPNWTFDSLLVTFIGGVGTLTGPIVGAAFYTLVREVLAVNLVGIHQVIFGALFIVVVLALPGGLIDVWSRIERRLHRRERSDGKRVACEVTALLDKTALHISQARSWTATELVDQLQARIRTKGLRSLGGPKGDKSILLIHTDELTLNAENVAVMLTDVSFEKASTIGRVFLLLSYDPKRGGYRYFELQLAA